MVMTVLRGLGITDIVKRQVESFNDLGKADSIDPTIISSTNFRQLEPRLSLEEVRTVVDELRTSGKLNVFDLAAYHPMFYQDHESDNNLVRVSSEIFSSNASHWTCSPIALGIALSPFKLHMAHPTN